MSQPNRSDPLQTLADIAAIANYFQTNSIKNKVQEIERTINQSAIREEEQTKIRQVVFQINNFISKESEKIKDKLVVAVGLKAIKRILLKSSLTSSSFTQISDKQFFQDMSELLESKIKEHSPYESESLLIENAYRQFKAFSIMANKSSSIKSLYEKVNNARRNAVIAFIIGFLIPFLYFQMSTVTNNPDNMSGIGVFIMCCIVGGVFAIFPLSGRNDNKVLFEMYLGEVMRYFIIADLKLDADNLMSVIDTSPHEAQIIKNRIDEYEKAHPDLASIKQLL